MLIKLLKYELKATGRIILPLYAFLVLASAGLALNMRLSGNKEQTRFLTIILLILFAVAVAAVFIATAVLIILRFYRNLLKEEGYLMFSLPVSTGQLIISKTICPVIWMILSLIVGLFCGFVMERILGTGTAFYDQVKVMWTVLIGNYGWAVTLRIFLILAAAGILSIMESIFQLFASMSIGQMWGSHRILGSILAYIGFSALETAASVFLNLRRFSEQVSLPSPADQAAQTELGAFLVNDIMPASVWIIGIAAVGVAIYGAITWFVLDRRLNLE